MKFPRFPLAVLAVLLSTAAYAQAGKDVHPYMDDKFFLEAGAFFPRMDLKGGVDGDAGEINPDFDFESQFGLSNSENLASADFTWRFLPKWSMHFLYFETGRTNTAVLQEDVIFGDATFEQGSSVSAGAGVDILRFFVGRDFSKRDDALWGVGIGLHRLGIDMSLSGNILVNGQVLANETRSRGATAPLPDIGGWYYWSPSPNWVLGGRVDWMYASIGEYDGGLLDAAFGVNYQFSRHFGVGAKYQQFELELDVNKQYWIGNVEMSFTGAFVFLSANWN